MVQSTRLNQPLANSLAVSINFFHYQLRIFQYRDADIIRSTRCVSVVKTGQQQDKMSAKKRVIRIIVISLAAWLIFSYVLIPLHIQGKSMEPTYHDGGVGFCWRQRYLFSPPSPGDVVAIRFAGRHVVLLKRVVALAGDIVEFRNGVLYVNSQPIDEPYVQFRSDWNLAPRTVAADRVYVVGDNRGVPMEQHHFGQVDVKRILGGVLW
jgi:signal peptidase I